MIAVSTYVLYEVPMLALAPALKQAAIWGGSSALATKVGQKKPLSPEEKKQHRKTLMKQFAIGAAAGGLSTLI